MRNYEEFSQDHYERIKHKLNELAYYLRRSKYPIENLLIEDTLFTTLMRINKKTTRYWREKGLISYSQGWRHLLLPGIRNPGITQQV